MGQIRSAASEFLLERLRRHWIDFIEHRNVLTHLKPIEGSQLTFLESAAAVATHDHLLPTLTGITYFVCHQVSYDLVETPAAGVVRPNLWDELKYEIGLY